MKIGNVSFLKIFIFVMHFKQREERKKERGDVTVLIVANAFGDT